MTGTAGCRGLERAAADEGVSDGVNTGTNGGWVGAELELRVDAVGHGGVFVARHEGRVVFVRRALPGEVVRAVVTEDRGKGFCRAETTEVLEAAPDRVADACPAASLGGAGCCDFSHVAVGAQRRLKQDVLAEQLERIAHLPRRVPVAGLPGCENGTGWRTRARLAADEAGRPGYRRHRSGDVVADLRCPQVVPGMLDGLAQRSWRPGTDLTVVLDDDARHHVVETAPPSLKSKTRRRSGRRGAAARQAARAAPRAQRIVSGGGDAVERVGGREWHLSPAGFWQVHRSAAAAYADVVRAWSGVGPGDLAWDLYGGAGVFAAVLAEQVGPTGRVSVVESSAQSVRDGRDALADRRAVRFRHGRVERVLPDMVGAHGAAAAGHRSPDVAVVDPPRAGAGRDVVGMLAASGVERIVHVGCDPAAFARDLALYADNGFVAEELRAYDGFPMTHHFESFALLTR